MYSLINFIYLTKKIFNKEEALWDTKVKLISTKWKISIENTSWKKKLTYTWDFFHIRSRLENFKMTATKLRWWKSAGIYFKGNPCQQRHRRSLERYL